MKRPIAFIIAACQNGMMIVNRNDHHLMGEDDKPQSWYTPNESGYLGYGIGHELLNTSEFSMDDIDLIKVILNKRKNYFGDGVVAIDVGANIGTHTIELARFMHGWGSITAYEAQEPIFYALAGNIVINNCLNARACYIAVGDYCGEKLIPKLNYFKPASFGSLEYNQRKGNEDIGQPVSYSSKDFDTATIKTIDVLHQYSTRMDFLKIDVEGMEYEVLLGARHTIKNLKPVIFIETIKIDEAIIVKFLVNRGYNVFKKGINVLAIHKEDPILAEYKRGI